MRNAALQPILIQTRGKKAFVSHTCCPFQGFPWWRCVLGCSGRAPRTPRHTCLYPEPRYRRAHRSHKHTVGKGGEILRRFSKNKETNEHRRNVLTFITEGKTWDYTQVLLLELPCVGDERRTYLEHPLGQMIQRCGRIFSLLKQRVHQLTETGEEKQNRQDK